MVPLVYIEFMDVLVKTDDIEAGPTIASIVTLIVAITALIKILHLSCKSDCLNGSIGIEVGQETTERTGSNASASSVTIRPVPISPLGIATPATSPSESPAFEILVPDTPPAAIVVRNSPTDDAI